MSSLTMLMIVSIVSFTAASFLFLSTLRAGNRLGAVVTTQQLRIGIIIIISQRSQQLLLRGLFGVPQIVLSCKVSDGESSLAERRIPGFSSVYL